MKVLNNPFVVYGYKGSEYFCDRVKETEILRQALHNERNVMLSSPRRLGKTGLIHHVFEQIESQQEDVKCFYVDLMNTKTLGQLVEVFGKSVMGKLDTSPQMALRKATALFSTLRPTLKFDELTGMPEFSVSVVPSEEDYSLKKIFDYLSSSNKRCYVAFDEFQQVTSYPETTTEATLRSYIQFLPNVYFIFAGSQYHLMSDMFLSPKRPFYLAADTLTLKEIDLDEYLAFANRHFKAIGLEMQRADFEYLYQLVDGQTYYVQKILNKLYEWRLEAIDMEKVVQAVEELINLQGETFENYYMSMTENQAALLLAIARERVVKAPYAAAFLRKHVLPALSSVKMALKSLTDKQLIYKKQDGYIVYDRFFALWLRNRL